VTDDIDRDAKMPRQVPFIIGNEACERFSFYGMRNILVDFLSTTLLVGVIADEAMRKGAAKDIFHSFVAGVYFFPLLGGWLSDRYFGKYRTILWFSLLYCVGQACLTLFVYDRYGFYAGMFLIALGSGGIKPLVSSFVGDQFDQRTKHLAKVVFDAFYWSINLGSFSATLLVSTFLSIDPHIAFAVPGVLMFIATIVFWAGRNRYIHVPPAPPNQDSFLRVAWTALRGGGSGTVLALAGVVLALGSVALLEWLDYVPVACIALVLLLAFGGVGVWLQLDRAKAGHSDAVIEDVRSVLRVLIVFALVTPFWSLFDQKASAWVLQGTHMVKPSWLRPSHMQAFNPALVMIYIPLNNLVIYPWLRKRGRQVTPLGKMFTGLVLTAISWVVIGALQLVMDSGTQLSIFWQILAYLFLTMGEVLVSATGLEFAYSQATIAMKGVIMSFWFLAVTVGQLWVLLADAAVRNHHVTDAVAKTGMSVDAFLMFFFAAFAFASAVVFRLYARRYKMLDNYLGSPPAPPAPEVPRATARSTRPSA
jgi:proton-dependent oligopeptide transporter, POT family